MFKLDILSKQNKLLLFYLVIFNIFVSLFGILQVRTVSKILDSELKQNVELISELTNLIVITLILNVLFALQIYLSTKISNVIMEDISNNAYKKLNILNPLSFTNNSDLIEKISSGSILESQYFITNYIRPLTIILASVFNASAILIYFIWTNNVIVLLSLGLIFLFLAIYYLFTRGKLLVAGYNRTASNRQRVNNLEKVNNLFEEIFTRKKQNLFFENHRKFTKIVAESQITFNFISNFTKVYAETITSLLILGLVLISQLGDNSNIININEIILLSLAVYRVLPEIAKISQTMSRIRFSESSYEHLKFIKNYQIATTKNFTPKNEFKLISPFFEIDLKIQEPKLICIYGQSGTGKTTVLRNIVYNASIPSLKRYSDKKELSENFLLDDSIYAFLSQSSRMLPTDFDKATIETYASELEHELDTFKLTYLKQLINNPNREKAEFDKLSGGEVQRLSLIQLKLNLTGNVKLILLDEPTSALDKKSEAIVISQILELSKSYQVIVATHNEQLISHADEKIHIQQIF